MTKQNYLQKFAEINLCILVDVNFAENFMKLVLRHNFARFLHTTLAFVKLDLIRFSHYYFALHDAGTKFSKFKHTIKHKSVMSLDAQIADRKRCESSEMAQNEKEYETKTVSVGIINNNKTK